MAISELAARIDAALKSGLPARVRVIGQISGFRDRTHWYFDLKDEGAVVNAVVFASSARRVGFTPRDGQEVIATGRCEFYAPQGRVSLIIDKLEPVGAGALELKFRALCEELRQQGYFDPARKRPLPTFPRAVAVITSRTGAALQDVIDTMRRRCPAVGIVVVDARMQGDRAAGEVAAAIAMVNANRDRLGVDAIMVTRGGGSMEDLWAFNERVVADAVLASHLPVIAAIGHETDTTVAELVADERAATPTQAAMRLTPDTDALGEQLESLSRRLDAVLRVGLRHRRQRLAAVASRPVFTKPQHLLKIQAARVDAVGDRLRHALGASVAASGRRLAKAELRLERHRPAVAQARREERVRALARRLRTGVRAIVRAERASVDSLERELEAVGPMSVLARGYSATLDESGRVVRSVEDVVPGQLVRTRVVDGSFTAVVSGSSNPKPVPPAKPRRAAKRQRGLRSPDQMDLFGGGG